MSMGMSLAFTQPSTTCINLKLNANSAKSKRQSSLASRLSSIHLQHGFQYYLGSSRLSQRSRMVTVRSSILPVAPPTSPTLPSSPASSGFAGKGWIAGILLSLVVPFFTKKWPKWGPLFFLKNVADQKLQAVEDIVEALEKVADTVEHMADDIGKDLPEGSFKRTAKLIEDAAVKVEAIAHFTDAAIDKIQELEDEVESIANQSEKVKASKLEANNAQQA